MSVQTIGTSSRNYSTLQAWEDAMPANLVTDGNFWQGECYNDSEFTATLDFSAHTTDSTHYIVLTAASGQSFQDNANVRTNALKYNQANGVAINKTTNYGTNITFSGVCHFVTFSRLQVAHRAAGGASLCIIQGAGTAQSFKIQDCIFEGGQGTGPVVQIYCDSNSLFTNLMICHVGTAGDGIDLNGSFTSPKIIGCTVFRPSENAAAGTGFISSAGTKILQSSCTFGFTTPASALNWDTVNSKFNATEVATSGLPGLNNIYSVTYNGTTPLTDANNTGGNAYDARLANDGNVLIDAGFRDATNAPNDISGTARGANPEIGAWELAGGVVATAVFMPTFLTLKVG